MKFNYKFDLSKWFDTKAGLITSFIVEILLLISVSIEIYTGNSDIMLMLILGMYLIDSASDTYEKIEEIKRK